MTNAMSVGPAAASAFASAASSLKASRRPPAESKCEPRAVCLTRGFGASSHPASADSRNTAFTFSRFRYHENGPSSPAGRREPTPYPAAGRSGAEVHVEAPEEGLHHGVGEEGEELGRRGRARAAEVRGRGHRGQALELGARVGESRTAGGGLGSGLRGEEAEGARAHQRRARPARAAGDRGVRGGERLGGAALEEEE